MRNWLYLIMSKNQTKDGEQKGNEALIDTVVWGFWIILTLIVALLVFDYVGHGKQFALGTFGDFFGGVLNPILSFFTLIGVAVNVAMQRAQTNHARADSRKNEAALRKQAFDATFFQMLGLHKNVLDELEFDPSAMPHDDAAQAGEPSGGAVHGKRVFAALLSALEQAKKDKETEAEPYDRFLLGHPYVLEQYFRNLHHILQMISRFSLDDKTDESRTQQHYADILKSQISNSELTVIFLHCRERGKQINMFRHYLTKFAMLENMRVEYEPSTKTLTVVGLDERIGGSFEGYFEWDYEPGSRYRPGAFGSSAPVRKYLDDTLPHTRQHVGGATGPGERASTQETLRG